MPVAESSGCSEPGRGAAQLSRPSPKCAVLGAGHREPGCKCMGAARVTCKTSGSTHLSFLSQLIIREKCQEVNSEPGQSPART